MNYSKIYYNKTYKKKKIFIYNSKVFKIKIKFYNNNFLNNKQLINNKNNLFRKISLCLKKKLNKIKSMKLNNFWNHLYKIIEIIIITTNKNKIQVQIFQLVSNKKKHRITFRNKNIKNDGSLKVNHKYWMMIIIRISKIIFFWILLKKLLDWKLLIT